MPSFFTDKVANRRCKTRNNPGNLRMSKYLTGKVADGRCWTDPGNAKVLKYFTGKVAGRRFRMKNYLRISSD